MAAETAPSSSIESASRPLTGLPVIAESRATTNAMDNTSTEVPIAVNG